MKTAISVPDETFAQATRQAAELGISRSEFFARAARRYLAPVVTSRAGRCLLLLVVAAGAGCLVAGPPGGQLSGASPATQVLLLLVLGLATSLIHEFAHAVVLVHYGRTPRYAGFGLYWGAVSFYVDSTPALTLPRR